MDGFSKSVDGGILANKIFLEILKDCILFLYMLFKTLDHLFHVVKFKLNFLFFFVLPLADFLRCLLVLVQLDIYQLKQIFCGVFEVVRNLERLINPVFEQHVDWLV